jgi:hypothetical protein
MGFHMLSVWYRSMKSLRTVWFANVKEVSGHVGMQERRLGGAQWTWYQHQRARAREGERYINTLNTRVRFLLLFGNKPGADHLFLQRPRPRVNLSHHRGITSAL